MTTTKSVTFEIELSGRFFIAEVEIVGQLDPGVHTFSNSDPGYPSDEQREHTIFSIVEVLDQEVEVLNTDLNYDAICAEIEAQVEDVELDYY